MCGSRCSFSGTFVWGTRFPMRGTRLAMSLATGFRCVPCVPGVCQVFSRFWHTLNLLFSQSFSLMCARCATCVTLFQFRSAKNLFLFLVVKLKLKLKKGGTHGTHYLTYCFNCHLLISKLAHILAHTSPKLAHLSHICLISNHREVKNMNFLQFVLMCNRAANREPFVMVVDLILVASVSQCL